MKLFRALFTALLPPTLAALATAQTETYEIDPVHSTVAFKIRHLGISWVNGNFADLKGKVVFDAANPEKSSAEVVVQAASVDTRNAKRDAHLRDEDFFHVAKFPTLAFKSTRVRKVGENAYEVTGDLSLLGVSRPITVTFTDLGTAKGLQGEDRRGGETSFRLRRSDFGMTKNVGPIGDEVEVTLAFSGVRKN